MAESLRNTEPVRASETAVATMPLDAGSLIQVAAWLVVVVGLILLSAWLFRRFSGVGTGGAGLIRVLTAISLGSRDRIALIQAGDKQILIGVSPGRINTLHVFDEPVMTPPPQNSSGVAGTSEFARRLQELVGKGSRQ